MERRSRIVILGAGFGGIYAHHYLHRQLHRRRDVEIVVISENNYFLFTPLLHEVATGGLRMSNLVQPLRYILGCCQTKFVEAKVQSINCSLQNVSTTSGSYDFDYCLVALGATTNFFNTPGASEHSYPLKTMGEASRLRNRLLSCLEMATNEPNPEHQQQLLSWVVVGGGPTGVELAAELVDLAQSYARAVRNCPINLLKVTLYQSARSLLPMFDVRMQRVSQRILEGKGVTIRLGVRVTSVEPGNITTDRDERITAGMVAWTAGVQPNSVAVEPVHLLDSRGRIPVTPYLTVAAFPRIFAIGDIASLADVPQTAQAAVRQARTAAANLVAKIDRRSLTAFTFKKQGDLVSIGRWQAVARIHGVLFKGRFAWWLWRTIYLSKLIGFPSKLRVAVDWTLDLFYPRDISRLS